MESKVVAGAGSASITAGGLGLLVAWTVDTFTTVQMPETVATVVGAIILAALAGAGSLIGGYYKQSPTSAVSSGFNNVDAAEALRGQGLVGAADALDPTEAG